MKNVLFVVALFAMCALKVTAETVITPVFPYKDGEASLSGYSGSGKELAVNGGATAVTSWVTFQTEGLEVEKVKKAILLLQVKSVEVSGTIKIRQLTSSIDKLENHVALDNIMFDENSAIKTLPVGISDLERILQIDITAALIDTPFYGIALTSDDGLSAAFSSKEASQPPMIAFYHEVTANAPNDWLCGNGSPDLSSGTNGDSYCDTSSGDLYIRSNDQWTIKVNLRGPKGEKGDQGEPGERGPKGEKGDQGISGPAPTGIELLNSLNSAENGSIAIERLPVGATDNSVSRGTHDHNATYYRKPEADSVFSKQDSIDEIRRTIDDCQYTLSTGNLVRNAEFRRGLDRWNILKGEQVSLIDDKGTVVDPDKNIPFTTNGTLEVRNRFPAAEPTWLSSGTWIPVETRKTYCLRGKVRNLNSNSPTGSVYLAVRLRDASGEEILSESHWWFHAVNNFNPTDTLQHDFEVYFGNGTETAFPANAATMTIAAIINSDPGSSTAPGNRVFAIRNLGIYGATGVVKQSGVDLMPKGMIVMWSGTTVPAGWTLCDGSNGSPDLRNRFVVGAGSGYEVNAVGGNDSVTLDSNQIPAHIHANNFAIANANTHGEGSTVVWSPLVNGSSNQSVHCSGNDQTHLHAITGSVLTNPTTGSPFDNRPPYFALAFIMKL